MSAPYDHEALWTKAKLFIDRAMDDSSARDFDERAFWAATSLELLAKAALAKYSPLLIAEPTEDGLNILIASGLVAGQARFSTVMAKTLWKRCQKAFKPFSEDQAKLIAAGRNEYLHGGESGFGPLPEDIWWQKYWAQAVILVTALDKDVSQFVGYPRFQTVEDYLDKNARGLEHQYSVLVERAKQRLLQRASGRMTADVERELSDPRPLTASMVHSAAAECPACGEVGVIEGDEVIDTRWEPSRVFHPNRDNDFGYDIIVTLSVNSEYFSCSNCRLVLNRFELIDISDLPNDFETPGDVDDIDIEAEYGND
ncbi:hypothetical protein ACO2Q7_14945 [Rathayibacter sp. KR2-224]|uniref:hypothetical protein n=1 Tax=Rathayibacter sp. KR2-224 TaxID=3400913 RepID=UPI003C058134